MKPAGNSASGPSFGAALLRSTARITATSRPDPAAPPCAAALMAWESAMQRCASLPAPRPIW